MGRGALSDASTRPPARRLQPLRRLPVRAVVARARRWGRAGARHGFLLAGTTPGSRVRRSARARCWRAREHPWGAAAGSAPAAAARR